MIKNQISKKIIISITLLLLFCIAISSANAAEHNITNTTTGGLNKSVVDANDGDTINLDAGIYTNNVTNITINKNLTIIGKGANQTIINAQKLGKIFTITNNATVTLINITFLNGNSTNGGALQNNGGAVTITNCIFINNTATSWGGAIYGHSANITIQNSTFNNNTANYGGAIYIAFGAAFSKIVNCTFDNNLATQEGGALFNNGNNYVEVIGSKFYNNIVVNNFGTGGAITNNGGDNFTVINSDFNNNTATFLGSAIYNDGNNFTITNSNFTNNKNSSVIFILENNATITGCNIINNTQGILIGSSNNTIINYNRIFNNTDYDLNNTGTNTNADLNWWGNNTPTNFIGITPNNWFVMNVTNLTSTVTNGSAKFNYTFGLNTNDPYDPSLLPCFVTNVYTNVTSGIQQSFDARFNRTVTVDTDKGGQNVTYTFVTDNEVKNISLFVEPTPTNLEVNNPKGKNGETVELIAKLTDDDGNPIAGKLITFHVGDKTLTAITDANGIARVLYTIDADDFSDGKLAFTATFEGDENYLASSDTGIITLIEEPIPPTPPEPTPEPNNNGTTNNSTTANATMKTTGIPINLILLVLLSIIGFGYYRKQ